MEIAVSIAATKAVDGCFHSRRVSIVVSFHQHGGILLRVGHFQHIGSLLESDVTVVGNLGLLTLGTLLCRDDNYTICCTHTIDSSCRSILKDRHFLNVFVVKEVDVVVEHSVYYIKWRTVSKRACSANTYGRTGSRSTAAYNVHTSHLTLKGCHG